MKIRTKICGITRPEDAQFAADAGADAVGLVFYVKSKRAVTAEQAAEIVAALPPFVSVVAFILLMKRRTISAKSCTKCR